MNDYRTEVGGLQECSLVNLCKCQGCERAASAPQPPSRLCLLPLSPSVLWVSSLRSPEPSVVPKLEMLSSYNSQSRSQKKMDDFNEEKNLHDKKVMLNNK